MEACAESLFPRWITSVFSRPRTTTGPSLSRPSVLVHDPVPRFVHVSLDSFFALVEQLQNPELYGRPVVVGRSTVLSASHEAILAGVQPSMRVEAALRVCPAAVVLEGRFALYAEHAEHVRSLLLRYDASVECGGCGDFYLDFAGRHQPRAEFRDSLLRLQMRVLDGTGLSASIGAGSTRAIAAIASRLGGPRGIRIVSPGTERAFLQNLPVDLLPGVSAARAAELAACEVTTIGALARVPRAVLEHRFGRHTGNELWHRARGRDSAATLRYRQGESISRRMMVEGGTRDTEQLAEAITHLCERIGIELDCTRRELKSISLAIRYEDDYSAQQSVRIERRGDKFQDWTLQLFRNLFTRAVGVEHITISVVPRAVRHIPLPCSAPVELPAAVNQ